MVYLCETTEIPYFLEGVRAQLVPKHWLEMLTFNGKADPDIHYILNGILNGFSVVDPNAEIPSYFCANYSSCKGENEDKLNELIGQELKDGKFSESEVKPHCVHSLGVIKKKNSSKIRPITDCSLPENDCVNCFMDQICEKFKYITIWDVVSSALEGKCYYISTLDLASAYRSVLINVHDRPYFGLLWKGHYYVDNFLCFGTKSAPYIFSRLTDAICRHMRARNIVCLSYLDDIICISKDYESGIKDQLSLISVVRKLGFYVAWSKVNSPTRCCTYLGIELDFVNYQLRLPEERMAKLRQELSFWVGRKKATAKQLEILIEH